jgi:hypothetical protein
MDVKWVVSAVDGWLLEYEMDIPLVGGWMDGWMIVGIWNGYSFFYAVNNTTVDRHKEYNSWNEFFL